MRLQRSSLRHGACGALAVVDNKRLPRYRVSAENRFREIGPKSRSGHFRMKMKLGQKVFFREKAVPAQLGGRQTVSLQPEKNFSKMPKCPKIAADASPFNLPKSTHWFFPQETIL